MPEKRKQSASSTRHTVSDLTLEQYHLGELSAKQERFVREELTKDESLRGRLAAIQASDEEIRSSYSAERVVPQIRERVLRELWREHRLRRMPTLAWALPLAAVALILLSLPLVLRPSDSTRLKAAAAHLLVFRTTAAGAEELRPGSVARKGDVLQMSYAAGAEKYGVIFSVDGRGILAWHSPAGYAGGKRSAPSLDPNGPVVLPVAYELDDAPGFIRFFLVYSITPFDLSIVERVARTLAQRADADIGVLPLPRGLGQFSFLLKKGG